VTELTPELAALFAATTGVGFLMMFLGVQKSMLEWRQPPRQCPSCGRRHRVCNVCTVKRFRRSRTNP
jgi:hypothetical protein